MFNDMRRRWPSQAAPFPFPFPFLYSPFFLYLFIFPYIFFFLKNGFFIFICKLSGVFLVFLLFLYWGRVWGMGEGNEMNEVDVRVVTWYLSLVALFLHFIFE